MFAKLSPYLLVLALFVGMSPFLSTAKAQITLLDVWIYVMVSLEGQATECPTYMTNVVPDIVCSEYQYSTAEVVVLLDHLWSNTSDVHWFNAWVRNPTSDGRNAYWRGFVDDWAKVYTFYLFPGDRLNTSVLGIVRQN